MLDLIEQVKPVQAIIPATGIGADKNGDWISMKDAHTVWAIATISAAAPSTFIITPRVSESYAGANSTAIRGGAKFWVNLNTTQLDRLTATSNTTRQASSSIGNCSMVVVRFNPAAEASSKTHFSLRVNSSCKVNALYFIEPRYAGYRQTIATTSST